MPATSNSISRRHFLRGSSTGVFLSGLGLVGCTTERGRAELGARVTLPETGPMLPPVPAILLTVNGMPDGPDEISVVWTFVVNGTPPQVGISVGKEHVGGDLIRSHGEFVLNVPTVDMVDAFDTVDMNSGSVGDKFELSGLTRGRATAVDAPTVEESPIHVECRVFDTIEVPPLRTVFLADVLATRVLQGATDDRGRLNVSAVPFFGMTAGSGEFYTMGRKVGYIGKSVGRDDIKY
ncbi:MAG: flavin reductase family protein [Gemmatimonadales bacterium]